MPAPSPAPPSPAGGLLAREINVRVDLISSIYSQIPASSLGVLAGALTVIWGMWGQVPHTTLAVWLAAIAAVLLWRLSLRVAFRRAADVYRRVGTWERYWTLSTGIHGSVWGSSALFMYVPGSPEHQALLLIALFALSTAAVPLIGRHLPSL